MDAWNPLIAQSSRSTGPTRTSAADRPSEAHGATILFSSAAVLIGIGLWWQSSLSRAAPRPSHW